MATEKNFQDDREGVLEREKYNILIGGKDRFLSGWGKAEGGNSYAFWACRKKHQQKVKKWVRSRGDIVRVRAVSSPPSIDKKSHCHIYVVGDGHPALAD